MHQQIVKGYVCTRDERMIWRYVVPIGLSIVVILGAALLIEAVKIRNNMGVWVFAFAWLSFSGCLIVPYSKVRVTPRLMFSIEERCITNIWPKDNKIVLDLATSYFCTIFTCPFAYGTATTKKSYYLFSEKPFNLNTTNKNGFYALEEINHNKVIIIPQTEITEAWVQYNLKATCIPIYPVVTFKQ